jgi:hypothetical protein
VASKIDFTDATGAASLSNTRPVPLDRFANWTPRSVPIGPSETALGTGQKYAFVFRDDHMASFEIRGIPNTQMAIMLRLERHLEAGGQVSVTTGDALGSVYATCCLAPDQHPSITLSDSQNLEYAFQVSLLNVAGSPVRMIVQF